MDGVESFVRGLREEVRTLPVYNSGLSGESVRARYGVEHIAKLGSNENPWGASPRVLEAVAKAVTDVALYPDPVSDDLRAALGRHLDVSPARVALGNGSEDLISIAAHTFLAPGEEMLTITPSFGLHVIYAQAAGARVRTVRVGADYRIDMGELVRALTPETRVVMLGNPSNPLGTSINADDLGCLLEALRPDTLLLFDEAYHEYAAAEPKYPSFLAMLEALVVREGKRRPWLLLRTFSKAYGLAGLRVGYGIASAPSLVDLMDRMRTPFNVNRLAQVAALAALGEAGHARECVKRTLRERDRLRSGLVELGYCPVPSLANFLFFDSREDAADLAARLLPLGVIVKPWREPGYAQHVRVSVGLPRDNDQFLEALEQVARPAY
jgi:histidinol-phosphate aminotransferase